MKPHICVITAQYPPYNVTGPGTTAALFIDHLRKKGYVVTVVTHLFSSQDKKIEKKKNFALYRITSKGILYRFLSKQGDVRLPFLIELLSLRKRLDFTQFDALFLIDSYSTYFLSKQLVEKVPTIASVNDAYSLQFSINPFKFPYHSPSKKFLRYGFYVLTRILHKIFLRLPQLIITNHPLYEKAILEHISVPKKNVLMIYKGTNVKAYHVGKGKYHSKSILFVGTNMERKGALYLLKALPLIHAKHPEATITFVGEKTENLDKEMQAFIDKYSLHQAVRFLGKVPQKEVSKYYEEANIFALPCGIKEDIGLAQTFMEAMASYTPSIATDNFSNKDALRKSACYTKAEDVNGIAQCAIAIFSDPTKAKQMGGEGRKRAEQEFNMDRMLCSYEEEINKLIKKKSH